MILFCFSVIDFLFKFLVVREHTLYNYNSFTFLEMGFMTQDIRHLDECSMGA